MIILCAFEMSAVVAFITRFTEENFALLIATIYIYKAFEKMMEISHDYPLDPPIPKVNATDCYCVPHNDTMNETSWQDAPFSWIGQPTNSCQEVYWISSIHYLNFKNIKLLSFIALEWEIGGGRLF